MENRNNENNPRKRKWKRSSNQMAKKMVRRAKHRNDIDNESFQYILKIFEVIQNNYPDIDDRFLFANNVYEETKGREIELARNKIGSKVLELLLKYASLESIQNLIEVFSESLRPLSSDQCGSHVLQNLIVVCVERANDLVDSTSSESQSKSTDHSVLQVTEEDKKVYNSIAMKLIKYFINNIEEFINDRYANHLIRTVIGCLGGLIDKRIAIGNEKLSINDVKRQTVTEEYTNLLVESCTRFLNWPRLPEFGREELTSGLLQSILYSLKDIDSTLTKNFIKKITKECFKAPENGALSEFFGNVSSIHLLEACIAVSSPKLCLKIYKKHFAGNVSRLCTMDDANFSVQKLMDHFPSAEEFESLFDELVTSFPDIFEKKRYFGVLVSLANACLRLKTKQGNYVNAIMDMLGCKSEEKQQDKVDKQLSIVPCCITMKKYEELEGADNEFQKQPTNLHGSLIVQAMLKFNKPIKIINSLMEMSIEQLMYLFNDPKGSHIVDVFVDGEFVGVKSRDKLAKKLRGCWADLALGKHGSRTLEKFWQRADNKQKTIIMDELAAIGESLRSNQYGKIIYAKLDVPVYSRNKEEWNKLQNKANKKSSMFDDIIKGSKKQN